MVGVAVSGFADEVVEQSPDLCACGCAVGARPLVAGDGDAFARVGFEDSLVDEPPTEDADAGEAPASCFGLAAGGEHRPCEPMDIVRGQIGQGAFGRYAKGGDVCKVGPHGVGGVLGAAPQVELECLDGCVPTHLVDITGVRVNPWTSMS